MPFSSPVLVPLILALASLGGCGDVQPDPAPGAAAPASERSGPATDDPSLPLTLERSVALADSVEDLLRPVPLMRAAQENELRRYPNAENVARARELGVRPADSAALADAMDQGRLVRVEDSTAHWVVRELGA